MALQLLRGLFKRSIPPGLVPVTLEMNGVKINKSIPTGWEYVTFGQFIEVSKAGDDWNKIISVFTGIEADTLAKAEIKGAQTLIQLLGFVFRPLPSYGIPKTVLGYQMPDNLELNSTARYQDLEGILKTFQEDNISNIEKYPLIVATYAVRPYDYQEAEKLAPAFLDAPALEVLAVGNFTLVNITALRSNMPINYLREDSPLSKLRLGMRNFTRRLDSTLHYYSWKRKLPTSVRSYLNGA